MSDDHLPAFEKLRKAAQGLPEVEAGTSYGTPALKLGKKLLCRVKDRDTVVLFMRRVQPIAATHSANFSAGV